MIADQPKPLKHGGTEEAEETFVKINFLPLIA
jgi:hypothetical protein